MDLDLLSSLESIDLVSVVDDDDLGLILAFLSFGLGAAQWFAGEKDFGNKSFSDIYICLVVRAFFCVGGASFFLHSEISGLEFRRVGVFPVLGKLRSICCGLVLAVVDRRILLHCSWI